MLSMTFLSRTILLKSSDFTYFGKASLSPSHSSLQTSILVLCPLGYNYQRLTLAFDPKYLKTEEEPYTLY